MTDHALPKTNQTSGAYLMGLLLDRAAAGGEAKTRCEIGSDVFIKQQSYARLNKGFFGFAVGLSALAGAWPVLVLVLLAIPSVKPWVDLVGATVLQTTVTAGAGACWTVYQFYKKRQAATENLLRLVAFSDKPIVDLASRVAEEMSRIDQGFGPPAAKEKQ